LARRPAIVNRMVEYVSHPRDGANAVRHAAMILEN
jgi:hypothetical protein